MSEMIIEARNAHIGPGMSVKRILPFRLRRMVGPFIFMDHAGPVQAINTSPQSLDVLPHPHIGLSTVSYLFGGKVTHRDSLGVEKVIEPGAVNWMTAGSGIAHSERFEDPEVLAGGKLEMIQTWVALPEKDEESSPSFDHYPSQVLPVYTDNGVWLRMIAGDLLGLKNSVKTHSPLFYMHLILDKNKGFTIPAEYSERAVYIVHGIIEFKGRQYKSGQMIVFEKGNAEDIQALEHSTLMLLGGEPLGERFIWWNFVSSRRERIEQAKNDWKEGRIILPPNDDKVFVPLPEEPKFFKSNPSPDLLS